MNDPNATSDHARLVVLINGEAQLEYDRSRALPELQSRYLDRMDEQMDTGVQLGSVWIEKPDRMQRARFVAMHLVQAIQKNDEASIAASCSWLASRLPELKQVKARLVGAGFSLELVFDKPYIAEATVSFFPPSNH
ncbi:MAG: hypothetical protein J5I92_16695 [Thiogranum sp.]|nr:hypothetical protein [Thiogranum sp.]